MAGKRVWTTDLLTVAAGSPAEYARLFDEITSALTTVGGLVQTNDTGQMNSLSPPALTSTSGATNQLFGYRIFRFNDALQATRPIFLRIELRYTNQSNGTSKLPHFNFQIGTGSDGVGNLVGAGDTRSRPVQFLASIWAPLTLMPTGVYPSYACGGNGFVWLAFKVGGVTVGESSGQPYKPKAESRGAMFILAIMRSTDTDGQPTDEGVLTHFGLPVYQNSLIVYWAAAGTSAIQEVRNTSGISVCTDFMTAPMLAGFQTVAGKPVLSKMPTPFSGLPASPVMGVTGVAMSGGDTFPANLVGAEERTYIYPGDSFAASLVAINNTRPYTAPFFLWEGPDL